MKYILNGLITILLSIIGFYAILTLLIFTVSDSDEVVLYAFAIVLGALLIIIINQLVRLNDKMEASKSELN
ncbi:hypothetical protein [Planococcus alpniumensis]|uniref:hypothetical protein n=1 Tax=Planococcus alpniumensis TaxID=2708345 RepID=UPI001B8B727C|nr:hypothetical protein [Planococcus sp. MSAK28401]